MNALQIIQQKLKSPKSQFNSFGKYNYRNQEDILEAVKPLLVETNSILLLSDTLVEKAGQIFIEAEATLIEYTKEGSQTTTSVTAYAKHSVEQKGMADAQITGSASSYARKYALNGLFLIDDTKDADTTNTHGKESKEVVVPVKKEEPKIEKKWLNQGTPEWTESENNLKNGITTVKELENKWMFKKTNKDLLLSYEVKKSS